MNKRIGAWLLGCCVLVLLVLVVGGATRLTYSGLSIAEWKPVTGALPPLSASDWDKEFAKYKATPEYELRNVGMSVEQFKGIFWWEWGHRFLARTAGLAFVAPFFFLALTGRIERQRLPRMWAVAALWAFQGFLGWFMVASGLVEQPRVSHYRLTAHLLAACALYGTMLWTAFDFLFEEQSGPPARARLRSLAGWLAGFCFVVIGSGGLVAGLRAGFICNTFPKMAGAWIPAGLLERSPAWLNAFENTLTVQFDHRLLAYALAAGVLGLWCSGLRAGVSGRARFALHTAALLVVTQAFLGVATLLLGVPIPLAVAHQGTAALLLGACLLVRHELKAN